MNFKEFQISSEGNITGKGTDAAGAWEITGKIEVEKQDDNNEYDVRFDKDYKQWIITYIGKVNNQFSRISGDWYFNMRGRLQKQETFMIEMINDTEAQINVSYTDGDKQTLDFEVCLDYEKFMFFTEEEEKEENDSDSHSGFSVGGQETKKITLYSQELLDNCQLSYTIFSHQTQFAQFRDEKVVISDF